MKKFLIVIAVCSGLLLSCGNKDNNKEVTATEKPAEGGEEHEENTATLTAEQIKSIGVVLGNIESKQLTKVLKTTGVLRVPNQNKATISSVYNGVIKQLLIQPGENVRKGQTIATIANPEFVNVQSDYLGVMAKIGLSELEVNRQRELNAGNAGALKNLQAAETELRTLRTARSTYEQQIRLMGINPASLSNGNLVTTLSVKSPINGVVSRVNVEIGGFVDLSTIIAEIVDNSQLHLDLFVYEKDLPLLKNQQLIHFTLTNNPGKEYDAQIYSLGSSFEGESKAVSVHARVQGDKTGLIDGMNITAAISLQKAEVQAVPSEAVVTIQGQDFIFITTTTEKEKESGEEAGHKHEEGDDDHHADEGSISFEKIPVAKGTTDVGYTEITLLKEIPKDAKIVVKGAFFVLAKLSNPGGHDH